jgi:hypothetical protein
MNKSVQTKISEKRRRQQILSELQTMGLHAWEEQKINFNYIDPSCMNIIEQNACFWWNVSFPGK